MVTQLNIKAGLKAFGDKGDKTILKEIKQLHTQQAIKLCSRNEMSREERKWALRYPFFLKEKRLRLWDNRSNRLCRQQATEAIYKQRRCKLTYCHHAQ